MIHEAKFPCHRPYEITKIPIGWFAKENDIVLANHITNDTKCILEFGSFVGKSTKRIAELAPNAQIWCVDTFLGSEEHQSGKKYDMSHIIPKMFDLFCSNIWDYKDRMHVLKMDTKDAIRVMPSIGISPDLIYIDASHDYEDVLHDVSKCHEIYGRNSFICGDDLGWVNPKNGLKTVDMALEEFSSRCTERINNLGRCWFIDKDQRNIHIIMVCNNYSDYLNITLPINRKLSSNITVVTSKEDKDTQKVCSYYGAKIVISDVLSTKEFRKGVALNDGFETIVEDTWVLIIDADIVLPNDFMKIFNRYPLNKKCMYGTYRYLCPDYEGWLSYLSSKNVSDFKIQKKIGVGFFQLFYNSMPTWPRVYPERSSHAGKDDSIFQRGWKDEIRPLEGVCPVHLGHGQKKINWYGRKSPIFGPHNGESIA